MRFFGVILRWLLAGICVGAFIILMQRATVSDFVPAAAQVIFAMLALISSVFLIIPETVKPFAALAGECFGSIFFPNTRFQKPPLSYLLANLYFKEMRYEEAVEEYRKIIRYYPDESTAYLELISIYQLTGETKLAKKYLNRFKRRFKHTSIVKSARKRPDR
jgi:tetratricopeptide (TPR) repeat protein